MCLSYLTFCANCAEHLLGAELVAELVAAVVDVHDDCSLFDPPLKRCDKNCGGLASFRVRRQVKCSLVAQLFNNRIFGRCIVPQVRCSLRKE